MGIYIRTISVAVLDYFVRFKEQAIVPGSNMKTILPILYPHFSVLQAVHDPMPCR